jgi:hypothetical protein
MSSSENLIFMPLHAAARILNIHDQRPQEPDALGRPRFTGREKCHRIL